MFGDTQDSRLATSRVLVASPIRTITGTTNDGLHVCHTLYTTVSHKQRQQRSLPETIAQGINGGQAEHVYLSEQKIIGIESIHSAQPCAKPCAMDTAVSVLTFRNSVKCSSNANAIINK